MPNRRTILALALTLPFAVLLLTGCGGGGSDFVGQWEVDPDAMRELAEANMPAEENMTDADRMARHMMLSMVDSMKMELDIREDNTFTATVNVMGSDESNDGVWSVSGGTITLEDAEGTASSRGTGTIVDGVLVVRGASDGGPEEIRFRRKPG